eukprot:m51a1_g6451 hypothetical protein (382) ;mRNA; r:438294-439712
MGALHESFGVCAVVVAIGHTVRRVFLTPETASQQIGLVSKLLMNATLPAVVLRALMRCRTLRPESLAICAYGLAVDAVLLGCAAAVFHALPASLVSRASGDDPRAGIAGDAGVELLAWLDLLNGLFIFFVMPVLYAVSARPAAGAGCSSPPGSLESALVPPDSPRSSDELDLNEALKMQELPGVREHADAKGVERQGLVAEGMVAVDRRAVLKRMGLKLLANLPLWSLFLGLTLGLGGASLPGFIMAILNVLARVNGGLSYLFIGLLLDLRPSVLRKLWRPVTVSMVIRYTIGISWGVLMYNTLGKLSVFSPLARLVLLIGGLMPTTVITGVYAPEWGWDPTLPGLLINTTIIASFGLLWAMIAIVGIPEASGALSLSSSG